MTTVVFQTGIFDFLLLLIFNQKNSAWLCFFLSSFPSLPPSLRSTDQTTLWTKGNKSSSFHLLLLMNDQLFVISLRDPPPADGLSP